MPGVLVPHKIACGQGRNGLTNAARVARTRSSNLAGLATCAPSAAAPVLLAHAVVIKSTKILYRP